MGIFPELTILLLLINNNFLLNRWWLWLRAGLESGPAVQQAGVLTTGLSRTLIKLRRTLDEATLQQQSHPAIGSFKRSMVIIYKAEFFV